jgi:UDP-N-acetylmuramate: L-alanyl-gamma-D-glutamyl-meso-diaminopimelate ligase
MKIHFIGIGERIMGDLAATLLQQGYTVTGSDINFSELALYSLESVALVPEQPGWFPQRISKSLDKVIVGRKVHPENPELQEAQRLGLPMCSYPEYIYEYAQDKQRIVITGAADKTMICVLVMHVLECLQKDFDYVVDSGVLEASVHLSDAPIIILAGDEAPSSPIDTQPQCLRYQHNIALMSGIGWQVSNTYPTLDSYIKHLGILADASPKGGTLIYCEEDNLLKAIGNKDRADVKKVPYKAHPYRQEEGENEKYLITPQGTILCDDELTPRTIAAAQQVLYNLAVTDQQFYEALGSFSTS